MTSNLYILGFISLVSWGAPTTLPTMISVRPLLQADIEALLEDGVTREYLLDVPESHDGTRLRTSTGTQLSW